MLDQNKKLEFSFRYQAATFSKGPGPKPSKILVYFHGFPDNERVWSRQEAYFSSVHQVFVGLPGVVDQVYSAVDSFAPQRLLAQFQVFLQSTFGHDDYRDHELLLVAHDMGGPYASFLAQQLKEQKMNVKLVLANSLNLAAFKKALSNKKQVLKSWYMLAFQFPIERSSFFVRKILKIGKRQNRPDDSLDLSLSGLGAYRYFARTFFHKDGGAVQVPTLFIWGRRDPFLELPREDFLLQFFTDFNLHIIHCGHWPMFEEASVFNELLEGFL